MIVRITGLTEEDSFRNVFHFFQYTEIVFIRGDCNDAQHASNMEFLQDFLHLFTTYTMDTRVQQHEGFFGKKFQPSGPSYTCQFFSYFRLFPIFLQISKDTLRRRKGQSAVSRLMGTEKRKRNLPILLSENAKVKL